MARNITDAQRQVTVPWKRLMTWFIVACIVVGGSIGGYYLYVTTSTAIQPPPVAQPPAVVPATLSETPEQAQPETLMPVLEVTWEEVKLPPLEYGYDEMGGFFVENEGNTISAYRAVGPANDGKATLYSIWKTTDGSKTWKEVEQVILSPDQEEELGFFMPRERTWGGNVRDPYLSEREELVKSTPDPLTDFGPPFLVNRDINNPNNILVVSQYKMSNGSNFIKGGPVGRLFLSMNGRWYQTNFPPCFATYDAYPETPQLTFLELLPPDILARVISTDDGSVNIYMTSGIGNVFWKANATIKSPN